MPAPKVLPQSNRSLYDFLVETYPTNTVTYGSDARYAKFKARAKGVGEHQPIPSTDSTLTGVTVTAATDVFTKTGHTLREAQPVQVTAKTGGTGITLNTTYYVHYIDANTFKLSVHPYGDDYLNVTADGSAMTIAYASTLFNTLALALPDPLAWGQVPTLRDLANALP